jgi:hypothetical protein
MPEWELVGGMLDALGVRHSPQHGELIAGAVVLLKVVGDDGELTLRVSGSEGLSWVERIGMYQVALSMEEAELARASGGD